MPKQPNYRFERQERDRAKALKLAQKAAAKAELKDRERDPNAPPEPAAED